MKLGTLVEDDNVEEEVDHTENVNREVDIIYENEPKTETGSHFNSVHDPVFISTVENRRGHSKRWQSVRRGV